MIILIKIRKRKRMKIWCFFLLFGCESGGQEEITSSSKVCPEWWLVGGGRDANVVGVGQTWKCPEGMPWGGCYHREVMMMMHCVWILLCLRN